MKTTPVLLAVSAALNVAFAGWFLSQRQSGPSPIGAVPEPARATAPAARLTGNGAPLPPVATSANAPVPRLGSISAAPVTPFAVAAVAAPARRAPAPIAPAVEGFAPAENHEVSRAVNASQRGNSFTFRGVRAAVAETVFAPGTGDSRPALGIDLSADDEDGSAGVTANDGQCAASAAMGEGGTPGTANGERRSSSSGAAVPGPLLAGEDASSSSDAATELTPLGLTAEEELFRAKWGWAAFDAARTAARKEALQ